HGVLISSRSIASRDLGRLAGEPYDVESGVGPIGEVDEAALVRLDVVGLNYHLAASRPVRHAALAGPLRRRGDVEGGLARRIGIADVDGPHAAVEVGDEHELAVEDRRERLARRVGPESPTALAEVALGLRHLERGDAER